jgi:hypothetical protein
VTYDRSMARGWESKAVEEEQSLYSAEKDVVNPSRQRETEREAAARARRKQELELQRERILSQRTSSQVRRAALELALADIESRLKHFS